MMDERNKQLLTRTEDRISFLYIDKARIEQTEYGIEVVSGCKTAEIPITTINCIMLGSGCSITQKALCNIASAGCSVCVTGMDMSVFYLYGEPTTNKSKNILLQMKYHENKALHLKIVHKMYEKRYPSEHLKTKTIEQLRGIEGQNMKACYEKYAQIYGLEWYGRCYEKDDFNGSDVINKYLTALNHTLYGIVTAAMVAIGLSPAIGFIHTGHVQSFVFDIADLYKEKYIIPLAFKLAAEGYYDRHKMLREFRNIITEEKLLSQIVQDIFLLFDEEDNSPSIEAELMLWGDKNFGISGKNYFLEP